MARRILSRKRIASTGAVLLVCFVLVELSSLLLFEAISGQPFDRAALRQGRAERLVALRSQRGRPGASGSSYAIHPYLGYAGRAGAPHPHFVSNTASPTYNEYGMLSLTGRPFPTRKGPDELLIAVLGGSVAEYFANTQHVILEKFLQRLDPDFRRKVVMVSLGTGGYKEPQSLFHLEYALLQGFEFDVVLNLNGFNELVFAAENHAAKIQPIHPSGYHLGFLSKLQPGGRLDPATVEILAAYYANERREERLLSWIEETPLHHSAFANLLGIAWSRHAVARAGRLRFDAGVQAQESIAPELRGPRHPWPRDPHAAAARIWRDASLLLAAVCRQVGLPYVHVLQPNQYVEGSKPLSEEERRIAFDPDHRWGRHARLGYPLLRAMGPELRAQGVAFYDLTMIFRERPETMYVDDCCHLGRLGNQVLANHVAAILHRELGPALSVPDTREAAP